MGLIVWARWNLINNPQFKLIMIIYNTMIPKPKLYYNNPLQVLYLVKVALCNKHTLNFMTSIKIR